MNKEYYIEYYDLEREHWWFRVRENIIVHHLQKLSSGKKDLKILNIGAATGRTSEVLSNFGQVISLEFDEDCCDFVKKKTGMEMVNASVLDLPFKENDFDLVCAFDIIEHVDDDHKAVEELKRVCKNDGVIFITVPAFMMLWSHHDVVNQHCRRYVMSGLLNLFKPEPEAIIFKSYFNFLLFPPILAFRLASRVIPKSLVRKGAGSDFSVVSNRLVNAFFYRIFDLERIWLKTKTFPVGVSLMFIYRNQKH